MSQTNGATNLQKLTTPRIIAGNSDVPDITAKMMATLINTSSTSKPIPPSLCLKQRKHTSCKIPISLTVSYHGDKPF